MDAILDRSRWVFLMQAVVVLAGFLLNWLPVTIFVVSTMPVFGAIVLRDNTNRCFGTIGLLAVVTVSIFSWNDKFFLGIVTAVAVAAVSIVVAAFEAQDAKTFHEAEESMMELFLTGLPYGIGFGYAWFWPGR